MDVSTGTCAAIDPDAWIASTKYVLWERADVDNQLLEDSRSVEDVVNGED